MWNPNLGCFVKAGAVTCEDGNGAYIEQIELENSLQSLQTAFKVLTSYPSEILEFGKCGN